jgi:hypothetical protein
LFVKSLIKRILPPTLRACGADCGGVSREFELPLETNREPFHFPTFKIIKKMVDTFFTEEQIKLFILLKQTKMDKKQAEAALCELERLGPVTIGPVVSELTGQFFINLY